MSNPMAEANVAIINELKKFLNTVSMEASQRSSYSFAVKDFTRKRVLTFSNVVMLITSALKRTLSIELQGFFACFSSGQTCSKQAFSAQRGKLKPAFFHDWNQVLVRNFYRRYGDMVKTWKGMTVWAVDGTTITLPQTDVLRKAFGAASNGKGHVYNVTARACLISDVLNGIGITGHLHPYFSSERDGTLKALEMVDIENKLLLFDRGYPSYWLEYYLMQRGAKFIMRARKNENKAVSRFLSSAATDLTADWHPGYDSLKKLRAMGMMIDRETAIRIRMVKVVLDSGETEVLITNLYDTQSFRAESLKEAYHFRWGIETGYGHLKEQLQLGQFSGIRQVCIEQDFSAGIFLYNMQSLIEKQTEPYLEAVCRKRAHRYKVNKNVSFGLLKDRVVRLFLEKDTRSILRELENLFGNYLEPLRPGRKYPRIKKRRPNTKYYTLTNYKRAI